MHYNHQLINNTQKEIKEKTGILISEFILKKYYLPLVDKYIKEKNLKKISVFIIGITGFPRIGKSTFTQSLSIIFNLLGYKTAIFSLDDFYKSLINRQQMNSLLKDNPFYQVNRGSPGTHRNSLLYKTLINLKKGKKTTIPIFDKPIDDISIKKQLIRQKVDFVIFEGWFVGAKFIKKENVQSILRKSEYIMKIIKKYDPKLNYIQKPISFLIQYHKIWDQIDHLIVMLGKKVSYYKKWRLQDLNKKNLKKVTPLSRSELCFLIDRRLPLIYLFKNQFINQQYKYNSLIITNQNRIPEKIIFNSIKN